MLNNQLLRETAVQDGLERRLSKTQNEIEQKINEAKGLQSTVKQQQMEIEQLKGVRHQQWVGQWFRSVNCDSFPKPGKSLTTYALHLWRSCHDWRSKKRRHMRGANWGICGVAVVSCGVRLDLNTLQCASLHFVMSCVGAAKCGDENRGRDEGEHGKDESRRSRTKDRHVQCPQPASRAKSGNKGRHTAQLTPSIGKMLSHRYTGCYVRCAIIYAVVKS